MWIIPLGDHLSVHYTIAIRFGLHKTELQISTCAFKKIIISRIYLYFPYFSVDKFYRPGSNYTNNKNKKSYYYV